MKNHVALCTDLTASIWIQRDWQDKLKGEIQCLFDCWKAHKYIATMLQQLVVALQLISQDTLVLV